MTTPAGHGDHAFSAAFLKLSTAPCRNHSSRYLQHMTGQNGWMFLTNHGHVLVTLAANPDARLRDVAERVGITERAVQQIVRELEEAGYVVKDRVGRRNHYSVVRTGRFRHPLESGTSVGEFIDLVLAGNAVSN